jgi:hypothetical protein
MRRLVGCDYRTACLPTENALSYSLCVKHGVEPKRKGARKGLEVRPISLLLVIAATMAGVVAFRAPSPGYADEEAAPIFGVRIPPGYRDWRLISVAREEGNLNDIARFWATM